MDKSVVNTFTAYVEQLRNTECSQKEKVACFQHIAECIMSPALAAHINYATHINMATTVLLLFCEDLDSVVRMSAEENLNKIFRALEKTRVSRILMDLYGEIKRNGNQRSLRICLNLFAYYAPQIREKNIKWYAIRILPCLQTIAQRKETQLGETLCEFVKSFGKYLQMGLTDSEICKLFEVFLANIGAECAVKRRCSAQNCISLIENSRNKSLMAKHGLNKAIEMLLGDQQNCTVLGVLGFLRLLLPLIIHGFRDDCNDDSDDEAPPPSSTAAAAAAASAQQQRQRQQCQPAAVSNECRQIIEIYDYCLHLLSISNTSSHSTINAALEVINAILQALDNNSNGSGSNNNAIAKSLQQLLSNQQLQHAEYLRRRKSLQNQIFQLRNYEVAATVTAPPAGVPRAGDDGLHCQGAAAATAGAAAGGAHSTGSAKIISVDDELASVQSTRGEAAAHKLRMQNVANAKVCQQQQQQPERDGGTGAGTSAQGRGVGIAGTSAADEKQVGSGGGGGAGAFVDDVDLAGNDDEAHVASTTYSVRHAARSISECVVDDDAAAADLLAAAAHTDVEGDDDDDDFTTLSEINEPQQQQQHGQRRPTTYALTTTIDVDNLIDAIDAANITESGSIGGNVGTATATPQRPQAMAQKHPMHQQQQEEDASPQNLLTPSSSAACTATTVGGGGGAGVCAGGGDDKSQHLSDIDNESFNSIDFESEITIAGIGGNAAANTGTTTTPTTAATTTTAAATATAAAKANVWDDERAGHAGAGDAGGKSSSDTIGSFFNNLISNAASESVSKLFRPSSAARSTPTKNSAQADKSELASPSPTSASATVDSLSMISNASSGNSKRDQLSSSAYMQSPSIASSSLGMHDDTPSTAVLADLSLCATDLPGSDEDAEALPQPSKEAEVELRRIPNANPFLSEGTPLKQSTPGLPLLTLNIGSVYEQPVVFYSARLIAARFLLTGQAQGLQNDSLIRISIKSLSLCALAHCVRLAPAVLQLPLEITEAELHLLAPQPDADSTPSSSASGSPCLPHSDSSSGSSNLGKDFEHLDERGDFVDFVRKSPFRASRASSSLIGGEELPPDSLLLDIKDDHFGKSTCDYLLQSSELSKSADPVLLAQQVGGGATAARNKHKKAFEPLSKSEIIETHSRKQAAASATFEVTESAEDLPPQMLPPRPPKRTKSLRKSIASAATTVAALAQIDERSGLTARNAAAAPQQQLSDILLYYNHADPMLRGGVQQIIGSFIQATAAGLTLRLQLNLQHLLAMLLKGLHDDIHTVVIQALNAFDKIFPCVVSKYLMAPTACHQQLQQRQLQQHAAVHKQAATSGRDGDRKCRDNAAGQAAAAQQLGPNDPKCAAHSPAKSLSSVSSASVASATSTTCPRTLFNDNDELIAALLNDFELQSKSKCGSGSDNGSDNTNDSTQTAVGTFSISPKLLLSKLRLCHHNKYWLVQNKYAEVISNLNYVALRSHCCRSGSGSGIGSAGNHYCDNNDVNATLAGDATAAPPMENDDEQDIVCTYEAEFLDELLQLIGDDDFRVREHAAQCLCRFIIQNAKQQPQQQQHQHTTPISRDASATTGTGTTATAASNNGPSQRSADDSATHSRPQSQSLTMATYETNFNLLWDFFDYRVFSGMSLPLRNLFRANSSIPPPLAIAADTSSSSSSSLSSSLPSSSSSSASASSSSSTAAAILAGWESTGSYGNRYAASALQRRMAEEERILAKVLYRMTNKLMALDDKNAQFGIIYALRVLLQHFNFIDYQRAWMEFNFMEICMRFSYYNYATAVDLSCQNDLIDVTGKLMAGHFVVFACSQSAQQSPRQQQQQQQQRQQHLQQQLDQLLAHTMKILNIYHHLASNQKPLLFAKVQKTDLFANARELALVQSVGYFGSDYVYIKLYNILRSANDSYKITINQESGRLLISLLRTCLNTLSLCIELRAHAAVVVSTAAASSPATPTHSGSGSGGNSTDAAFPSSAVLKLIEEILQYLTKLVNYAPGECIACLRQLLKYLFGQNYGNRQRDYYATFVRPYFVARRKAQQRCCTGDGYGHGCGDDGEGDGSDSAGDSGEHGRSVPPTMSPPPVAINSSATTASASARQTTATRTRPATASKAAAALATATARVTATATAIGAATATVMGMTASVTASATPTTAATMTSSTVAHTERNVIGTQSSCGDAGADAGDGGRHTSSDAAQYYRLLGELFASGLRVSAGKSERESECAKHIKLFEPLVIHSLMLFLKSNAKVQAPILELLSQLLDLNVTYSVLDSKNVIFDQIINNLDLIENGIARNGHLIVPAMMKFLVQLTHKSDRKLITIPKIISITNNLLANNAVRDCAVLALKSLAYEIFFMAPAGGGTALNTLADYRAPFQSPVTRSPLATPIQQRRHAAEEAAAAAAAAEALLASSRELDTQKEVVLGMLEKFVDASQSQLVIGLLLLRERSAQQLDAVAAPQPGATAAAAGCERTNAGYTLEATMLQDPSVVYAMICRAMCEGRLSVNNWNDFHLVETCFKNYDKYVLAHSKEFLALLQLFIAKDVSNFCDLSHATIILANVILKTEEIYLVNHIKLYLKNHRSVEERALRQQLQRQQQHQQHHHHQHQHQQQGTTTHWLLDGPSTSAAAAALAAAMATLPAASSAGLSEINYFARVLCEKLEACFVCLHAADADAAYCRLVARFVEALHAVCCRSRHKDALQSVFRLVLAESDFLDKYYNFAAAATPTVLSGTVAVSYTDDAPCTRLQLEVFILLSAMKLLDAVVLLQLQRQRQQQIQAGSIKWHNEQRTLLREICQQNPNPKQWTAQQVQQLLDAGAARSGDAAFLNFLIADNFAFVGALCEVDAGLCSLWQRALQQHADALNKHSIRALGPLLVRHCSANKCGVECAAHWLELVLLLHARHANDRALQTRLDRLALRLAGGCALDEETGRSNAATAPFTSKPLIDWPDNQQTAASAEEPEQEQQRIIDEKWLLAQLIKFSTQRDYQEPQQLARILLEIQSEHKLHKIFNSGAFDVARVLRHAIASSLLAMLAAFRSDCVQHNPHIHYMQPNPLVRVCGAVLMTRIGALVAAAKDNGADGDGAGAGAGDADGLYLCGAVIALIECIKRIEATALVYIESRFIDKFVREHLLRPEHIAALLGFLEWCCRCAERLLQRQAVDGVGALLHCIEVLLQQKFIWQELNQTDGKPSAPSATSAASGLTLQRRNVLLCRVLDVLLLAARQTLQNTIFYKRYQALQASVFGAAVTQQRQSLEQTVARLEQEASGDDAAALLVHVYAPKAVFLAKLIEERVDVGGRLSTAYIAGGGAAGASGSAVGGAAGCGVGGGGVGAGAAPNGVAGDFESRCDDAQTSRHIFESIGIALLRTNQFYAYAVTPFEIIQQQQREQQLRLGAYESPTKRAAATAASTTTATSTPTPASTPSGKLPTIPVESLSDVDVLRKFVKRLSIFGFTTRQQFEEYFMTFLLLINKVYDENMVDEQEQFQIKSTCLEAILELLITYKSFPIVGNKLSHFHHTTRWSRINCDSISLKKLHKVQLLVAESNVFYQPNLERRLGVGVDGAALDNIIGTGHFGVNQYDLNFVWQQMEVYAQLTTAPDAASETGNVESSVTVSAGGDKSAKEGADTATRNYRYFTAQSGVDFKSSAQLIFDVLMQIIEHNHILVLPNLVKFCEICESREQIKWIKDKALKLQETIPMDDTISHQHLIYLLCKTQAMLIPTLGELQQLCALIGNYLKSSHIFIRNATLAGVLCLLECCSKTNTSIGKLSEELSLLRELIVGYINRHRHGIIDASAMQCSDTHTKLVWTLNYCLIEWTSKFVPQCHLLSNTVIAAGNLLRKTSNEDVYLCVLHGLERMVVIGNNGSGSTSGSGNAIGSSPGGGAADDDDGGGIVSPVVRHKIEKLALELVKLENERFSIPALQLLLTCTYMGSAKQLESTELSNGIVQDDPEIIAQQTDKVDILLHCIKSSTREAAWIYGRVLCQIIRDLVPPNEILTKVIKEFLAVNQPHCDVIAMIVYQVFRCAIDSSFLQVLQDWLICSLPTFLALPERRGVWCLSVIFLSASINLHLIKLFPVVLGAREFRKLGQHEIALFVTAAQDFHAKLSAEQRLRFRDAFEKFPRNQVYAKMLHSLW